MSTYISIKEESGTSMSYEYDKKGNTSHNAADDKEIAMRAFINRSSIAKTSIFHEERNVKDYNFLLMHPFWEFKLGSIDVSNISFSHREHYLNINEPKRHIRSRPEDLTQIDFSIIDKDGRSKSIQSITAFRNSNSQLRKLSISLASDTFSKKDDTKNAIKRAIKTVSDYLMHKEKSFDEEKGNERAITIARWISMILILSKHYISHGDLNDVQRETLFDSFNSLDNSARCSEELLVKFTLQIKKIADDDDKRKADESTLKTIHSDISKLITLKKASKEDKDKIKTIKIDLKK